MSLTPKERREARHKRVRRSIFGTSERPRLSIFRSNKHLYAQAINDHSAKTLFSFSTVSEKFRKAFVKGSTKEAAKKLAEVFGSELAQKGIRKIIFDRSGYKYHGRVKELAEALRKAGVDF